MNWSNIDLNSEYERNQDFLNGYDFETLILELTCNYPAKEITPKLVRQHAINTMSKSILEAISIIENNAVNIAKEVKDYHKQD